MGYLRFWRRVKIASGLTLNLSKSGGSLSVGPRGAKVTIGPRGRRATVGIPGTGLFYTQEYVQTALRLYKARALNGLNMHIAARDLLTETLRRRKDREASLLNALRYERALAYESLGQSKRARSDLEAVFVDDPDFEDVADRLMMGSGGS